MSAVRVQGLDDEILEFEDVFEIITPGTIERRIHTLDAAWQQLYIDNKKDTFIIGEVKKWNAWATKLLDSWTDRFFGGLSAQKELETWQQRYKSAYDKSQHGNAPSPDNLIIPESILTSPAFWTVAGIVLVLGVYLYGRSIKI